MRALMSQPNYNYHKYSNTNYYINYHKLSCNGLTLNKPLEVRLWYDNLKSKYFIMKII